MSKFFAVGCGSSPYAGEDNPAGHYFVSRDLAPNNFCK